MNITCTYSLGYTKNCVVRGFYAQDNSLYLKSILLRVVYMALCQLNNFSLFGE